MNEPDANPAFLNALRWLALLPAVVVAAWYAIALGNRLSLLFAGYDPDSFFGRMTVEVMSHLALGGAAVYVGARVAPTQKETTAVVVAGLMLVLFGFLLFPALLTSDWWAVVSLASVAFGSGALAWSVVSGETDVA